MCPLVAGRGRTDHTAFAFGVREPCGHLLHGVAHSPQCIPLPCGGAAPWCLGPRGAHNAAGSSATLQGLRFYCTCQCSICCQNHSVGGSARFYLWPRHPWALMPSCSSHTSDDSINTAQQQREMSATGCYTYAGSLLGTNSLHSGLGHVHSHSAYWLRTNTVSGPFRGKKTPWRWYHPHWELQLNTAQQYSQLHCSWIAQALL